jgi:hypothetical protein
MRDARIRALEGALGAQRAQAEYVSRRLADLVGTLHGLQASMAWRLPQPLRKMRSKWPRCARGARRLFTLLWWTLSFRLPACRAASTRLQRSASSLAASGLFDTAWYLAQNPDVAAAGLNPLSHYVAHGAQEGRQPHPLFAPAWYLGQHPDVAAAELNPLLYDLHQKLDRDIFSAGAEFSRLDLGSIRSMTNQGLQALAPVYLR